MTHTKKESINNTITYVVPKNKTMAYSMSLVISIFIFKKYWQIIFNFMELNMSPTFKQLLKSETVNAEKIIILSMIRCKNNESLQ